MLLWERLENENLSAIIAFSDGNPLVINSKGQVM